MNLFGETQETQNSEQSGFAFPQQLTEKYRPQEIEGFAGLEKPKAFCKALARNPRPMAILFDGASGTGKTTMALALAKAIPAEVHHIPSQDCNLENLQRVRKTCQYVPMAGYKMHMILIDEGDQMTPAAQTAMLSMTDTTDFPPNTIVLMTANHANERLQDRLLSRFHLLEFSSYGIAKDATALLEKVFALECSQVAVDARPNFARIVKESNNNVREALTRLETEIMILG